MRRFRHLTRTDRLRIEMMLKAGTSCAKIAEELGVHRSTIYYEKKKGMYMHRNSDWTEEPRYSADLADMRTREAETGKGPQLKIGNDHELAAWLENKIKNDRYSPATALQAIRREGRVFSVTIKSPNTIYSYIKNGLFMNLTVDDLPVLPNKKRGYTSYVRKLKRAPRGESIERRPEEIKTRSEFGHWEMDTVVSARGCTKALLVMDERMTRRRILRLLDANTTENVVNALDDIERGLGGSFSAIFKTITCDNGAEFSDAAGIQRSVNGGTRTKVYFCHPYCSSERGTNENQNRFVRRWLPKGTMFDSLTPEIVQALEDWINRYPRKLLGWMTSEELFQDGLHSCINVA